MKRTFHFCDDCGEEITDKKLGCPSQYHTDPCKASGIVSHLWECCAHCFEPHEKTGHMGCQYPQNY